MRRFITFGPALVVLLTAVVTLLAAPAAVRMVSYANTEATMHLAQQQLDEDNVLKQLDRAVRALAEAVEPSVVHIAVNDSRGGSMGGPRGMRLSQGSGWVFDTAGHVVTNAHVVDVTARAIEVTFQDGRTVPAELVGRDPATDVAVIKLRSTEGLFPARRGTDLDLHQGERVYAFGSPFGFKFSMSEGIVSGLGRDPNRVIGQDGYTNFIQTDAAVNPGNSGGPLVNVEGKVVGMNVAIATAANSDGTSEGQNSGISFAIPLSTIESVVGQLINTGQVTRGYLGISHVGREDLNERELVNHNVRVRGVYVSRVEEGGPAEKAGLKAGDVITKINGRATPTIAVFRSAVVNNAPGEKAQVEVYRDGDTVAIPVTVGELAAPTQVEINEAFAALQRFGIIGFAEGNDGTLFVNQLIRGSRAMRMGLQPGAVITQAEGKPVATRQDLFMVIGRQLAQGRKVSLTFTDGYGAEKVVEVDPTP